MSRSVLILGENGQLARCIKKQWSRDSQLSFLGRPNWQIEDLKKLKEVIASQSVEVLINCIAYTNVDLAESEPDETQRINALFVADLARICSEMKVLLIHFSTDYVFSGQSDKPYREADETSPKSVYGESKRLGEQAIENTRGINAFVVRTSWLYSEFGNNFLKTVLRLSENAESTLRIVGDQWGSPTNASDLARFVELLIHLKPKDGVEFLHFSNRGVINWFGFAEEVLRLTGRKNVIQKISTAEYPTSAERPKYSVLDSALIQERVGQTIPDWKSSLASLIKEGKL